jgi:hypothetical protein
MERFYKREGIETCNCKEEEEELMTCERTDIPRKSNRKSKNIIFVIEGEFDITKMSELPDHIVHYCISFLATEEGEGWFERNAPRVEDWWTELKEFRHNRPSEWFNNLLRSETERLWNTKYVPMLTKAFNKIPVALLQKITRFDNEIAFVKGCDNKKNWISIILNFENFGGEYRTKCVERILLSKGLTFPDDNPECWLESYNPENFVAKLSFK